MITRHGPLGRNELNMASLDSHDSAVQSPMEAFREDLMNETISETFWARVAHTTLLLLLPHAGVALGC